MCFLYCCGAPRDLHSFPTRRSSDLGGHSAYPEHGRSAVHEMLEVLDDVRDIAWPHDEFYGETTCNVGVFQGDRKSTRLNSSHSSISYAVFCLKKKIH